MRYVFWAMAVGLIVAGVALGKPTRPMGEPGPPGKGPAVMVPDVSGETNWGTITQTGKTLSIFGNWTWSAPTGEILEDGKVLVRWWNSDERRPALGLYRIEGENLVGFWGWENECEINEEGVLAGSLRSETLWKVER